jgi:hypothetical protein
MTIRCVFSGLIIGKSSGINNEKTEVEHGRGH